MIWFLGNKMLVHPKTNIEIIGVKPARLENFKSTMVIPRPTIVPEPIFFMPLKTNLNILIGTGPATFTRVGSTATSINPATGLLVTHPANVPRFETNGILIEGKSKNFALHNRDLTNAVWAKTGGTATKNAIGLDGNANAASSFTATAPGATVFQTANVISTQANTFSIDIRRKTGSGLILITDDAGGTTTDVTSLINSVTYTRFRLTRSTAVSTFGVVVGSSSDGVEIDYGCYEERTSLASSRTETGATPVVRELDALSVPVSNFPAHGLDYSVSVRGDTLGLHIKDEQGLYGIEFNTRSMRIQGANVVSAENGSRLTHSLGASSIPTLFTVTVDNANTADGFKLYNGTDAVSAPIVVSSGPSQPLFIGASGNEPVGPPIPQELLFGHMTDFKIWGLSLSAIVVAVLNE